MTVATLEEALLWDVCADPDDDLPRLAYADWLLDRGEPGDEERAEFIHVQMELFSLESAHPDPGSRGDCTHCLRYNDLRLREALLQDGRRGEWWTGPRELLSPAWWTRVVVTRRERGFVHSVGCDQALWLRHGHTAVVQQPILAVTLRGFSPLQNPYGFSWWRLSDGDSMGGVLDPVAIPPDLWRHLTDSPRLVGYRTPDLAQRALSQACVRYARFAAELPPHPFVVVPQFPG